MSRTSQLGLIQLGLMQLGSVSGSDGISVFDSATLSESVSVSVIGDPWLLEPTVFDSVTLSESVSRLVGVEVSAHDLASVSESVSFSASGNRSALLLLGVG